MHFLSLLYRFKVHHILFWTLYIVYWMAFYRSFYTSFSFQLVVTLAYMFFHASSYYVTAYYLFPKFFYTRKYPQFVFSLVGLMLLTSAGLVGSLYALFIKVVPEVSENVFRLFQVALLSNGTIVGILGGAKFIVERIKADKIASKLEQERLESELQYLKAQVNPHFLFNAINSIYFLIQKDPGRGAETLIRLSDLLRFQLYDCAEEQIAIEKEIEYLNNFIALEKIRKGDKVKVDFQTEGNLSGFRIAPFLLIPFLENAFKHVSNFSHRENYIGIRLEYHSGAFVAQFTNTTDDNKRVMAPGGIGLKNVKRRLELIYPDRHELQIAKGSDNYSVTLTLKLV